MLVFTVNVMCGLLRIITCCYDIVTAEFHDLLRVVTETTSKLRIFDELFTDCYEYITKSYDSSKILRVSYALFTKSYELVTSIYEYLRFFGKKYIKILQISNI